jgi:hypothetical protein
MVTALTYMLTCITLASLLAFSGRQRHEVKDGVDRFGYPSILIWVAFGGIVFFLLVPFAVYFLATPNRNPKQLFILLVIFGVIAALVACGYLHMKRFFVEVAGDELHVGGLGKTRQVSLRDVQKIVVVEGGKGGKEITVYGRSNAILLKASSTIRDFDELLAMIQQRVPARGVAYEYRDKWGKWTRRDRP